MAPKKKTEGYETNHYGVLQGKTSGTLYEDTSSWSRQEQNSRMRVSDCPTKHFLLLYLCT